MTVPRAAVYVRLSHDHVGEVSTVAQEADARRLCRERGLVVADVYKDVGVSAYKDVERPERDRMMADVGLGLVDVIVVYKIDRFARSIRDFVLMLEHLEGHGCTFASVHDPVDTSTPIGRAMLHILMVFAQLESDQLSLRLRTSNRQRAALGLNNPGGCRPFGYEPDKVTIRPEEAELIRQAARDHLAGKELTQIAREWNELGILTSKGNQWVTCSMSSLLKNPRNAGLRRYRITDRKGRVVEDQVNEAEWPAILDPDVWRALRDAFAERARPKQLAGPYLLDGLLLCGRCGHSMVGWYKTSSPEMKQAYRCPRDSRRGICGRVSATRTRLDDHVANMIFRAMKSGAIQASLAANDLAKLDAAIASDDKALAVLAQDFYTGDNVISRKEFNLARATIAARLRVHQTRRGLKAPTDEPIDGRAVSKETWDAAAFEWRRHLVIQHVRSILIHPRRQGGNKFDTSRFIISWWHDG